MVCFDTDFLIAYLQRNPHAIRKLELLKTEYRDNNRASACTTSINAVELYKGVYRVTNREREAAKVKQLMDSLDLLTLDHESARLAGELDAATKSKAIGDLDLIIASIALTNSQTLITRNVKHFERVPGLTVESW